MLHETLDSCELIEEYAQVDCYGCLCSTSTSTSSSSSSSSTSQFINQANQANWIRLPVTNRNALRIVEVNTQRKP